MTKMANKGSCCTNCDDVISDNTTEHYSATKLGINKDP